VAVGAIHEGKEPSTKQVTTVGFDLAKNVFQVHGVDADGRVVIRRKLRRQDALAFFRITKMRDKYIRNLLVLGAAGTVRFARTKGTALATWIAKLVERKPARLATVALAN
jgi:transposase